LTFIRDRPWPGRTGSSTRAIMLALAKKYATYGNTPFNASQRELAELSGIGSRATVMHALTRLEEDGLVRRRSGHRYSAEATSLVADAWEFVEPLNVASRPANPVSHQPLHHLGHDAFRANALGKTAQYIFDLLKQDESLAVNDLV